MELGLERRYIAGMATITFDTPKLARKLEAAGFPHKQTADTAERSPTAWVRSVTSPTRRT
jgi:hypothetical protein